MAKPQPRYWDLFLLIFLLLGGIGAGGKYFYDYLQANKPKPAAAKPAPKAPEPVPEPEPEPEPEPVKEAPKPKAAKPKPYPYEIVSKKQDAPGLPITFTVTGQDQSRMARIAATEAFVACFWDQEISNPLSGASREHKNAWGGWVMPVVKRRSVNKDERGLRATYVIDIEKARAALKNSGVSFRPTVPSIEIETNGSYAPDDMAMNAVSKAAESSPYFISGLYFTTPSTLQKSIDELSVTLDGEPYAVDVVRTKDFGDSPVGRSILYYVNVIGR